MRTKSRRAFSLPEVLIALLIATTVLGGTMMMWFQGTRQFYKTSEHASIRAEAMLCLERIAQDLEQLVVSSGKNPETGRYSLLEPYWFEDETTVDSTDPATGAPVRVPAGKALCFYRFHHVENGPGPEGSTGGESPVIVGRKITYQVVPVAAGNPEAGHDLLRNGVRVNRLPLADVLFHKEPQIVSATMVRGSPHAIVSVSVVPKGGLFGNMGTSDRAIQREILDSLRARGSLVGRTFHLVGYESMYTSMLYQAMEKGHGAGLLGAILGAITGGGGGRSGDDAAATAKPMTELENALLEDARTGAGDMFRSLVEGLFKRPSPAFEVPEWAFALDPTPYTDDDAYRYASWTGAEVKAGATSREIGPDGSASQPISFGGSAGSGSGIAGSASAGSGSAR